MADVIVEKSADDLRREIDELHRQQREISERLRDPRGLRKSGVPGLGTRGPGVGPQRLLGRGAGPRGAIRRGDVIDAEDQPPMKKRLSSAVVKVEGDEGLESVQAENVEDEEKRNDEEIEGPPEQRRPYLQRGYVGGRRDIRDGEKAFSEQENEPLEPLPRVMPKIDDPNVAKRNRRMFGSLLGTLEKFRQEDKKLSGSEAFMRRSTSQKRAEQRAQEESDRLRQQEREQIAGKRKRDLVLRARLAAKAEEKQLEVLFIQWTEHQTKLCSFLRTKAEPAIFYMPSKPSEETDKLLESRKEELMEWKTHRRGELKEYQKQATEAHLARVEVDITRWQAGPQQGNNAAPNSNTAVEDQGNDVDGLGNELEDHEKHGWRRPRDGASGEANGEDDNVEDDQGEDVAAEVKLGTQIETKGELLEAEEKESNEGEVLDRKDVIDGGALKDVMDYGSGEEDMEET